MSQPIAASSPSKNRFTFIDATRGLYIFWMLAAHTLTLADVPSDSPLQVLRPAGWSTLNFIMLTGFSLAVLYSPLRELGQKTQKKLIERALQVGIIALISNFLFVILKLKVSGQLGMDAMISVLTLQEPWTISAVLLPTVIVLALSPFLLKTVFKVGSLPFFAAATAMVLLLECTVQYNLSSFHDISWFSACFDSENAYFGFPILKMACFAIWSFSLGALIRVVPIKKVMAVVGVISLVVFFFPAHMPFLAVTAARFGLSLSVIALADSLPLLNGLLHPLRLLGRSSLLIFFLHRVVAQIGRPLLGVKLPLHSMGLGGMLMGVTLAACLVACYAREQVPQLHAGLKKYGL